MPDYTQFSKAPLPTGSEAGAGPANLLAYASAIDDLLVLKATSQSDRDTKYNNVTAGTLVSCAALGIVWQKTTSPPTAATWRVLAEVTDPVTSGIFSPNAAGGWSLTAQWGQRINGRAEILLTINYTGSDIAVQANGNMADQTIGSFQSGFQLASNGPSLVVLNAMGINRPGPTVFINKADQTLRLADVAPGTLTYVSGNGLWLSATYPVA